jgi:hypothetical protein
MAGREVAERCLACEAVVSKGRDDVDLAPPAPIVERIPPSPGPLWVWDPGHHVWRGGRYEAVFVRRTITIRASEPGRLKSDMR